MLNYDDLGKVNLKELLSLTLRENGNRGVVTDLVERFPTARELSEATTHELTQVKGLGPAKAALIKASVELGKRIAVAPPDQVDNVRTPNDAYDLVQDMRFLDREHFRVLLLNTKHRVIRIETVTIGTLNSSPVHPREVFKPAIKHGACAVVLAHNHPSGDPEPSSQDLQLTQRLVEAGRLIGIEVLDHIIVGDGRFVSLKERGSL